MVKFRWMDGLSFQKWSTYPPNPKMMTPPNEPTIAWAATPLVQVEDGSPGGGSSDEDRWCLGLVGGCRWVSSLINSWFGLVSCLGWSEGGCCEFGACQERDRGWSLEDGLGGRLQLMVWWMGRRDLELGDSTPTKLLVIKNIASKLKSM